MSGRGSTNGSSSSSPKRPSQQRFPNNNHHSHNGTPRPTPPAIIHAPPLPPPPPAPSPAPPAPPPLLLTVRFSSAIDDILLDIPHPHQTTVVALKHLIRSRLTQPDSQKRLRFIHSGKLLPDHAILGAVLKPLPPPPRDDHTTSSSSSGGGRHRQQADPKGKGKAVQGASPQQAQRVYINCSIDVQLTDAELAEEKRRAEEPPPAPHATTAAGGIHPHGTPGMPFSRHARYSPGGGLRQLDTGAAAAAAAAGGEDGGGGDEGGAGMMRTTDTGPRGFDRLLSAGMSTAEVNQLRLSFRSLHEARNTADTMPSPDTLRDMEDAWLDNNNDAGMMMHNNHPGGGGDMMTDGGGGGGGGGGGDEFGLPGVLDLLIKGMFIGFVWPLGAIAFLVRGDEERIPKRMRMFVYFGFVLSLLVGTIRVIG